VLVMSEARGLTTGFSQWRDADPGVGAGGTPDANLTSSNGKVVESGRCFPARLDIASQHHCCSRLVSEKPVLLSALRRSSVSARRSTNPTSGQRTQIRS